MILEFKVKETEEKTLQETVQKALAQIEIKKYDAELKERGIPKERIRHYGFAFEGKKVLIVDVDSQCNSTSFFNLAPGCASLYELLASVYDEEAPEIKPESCIYPTEIGCSILPNVEEMAFIEAEFYKNESYIVALRERLREYATKEFDITLIDCPPSMGAFVYMAMIASDFIIVPIRAGSRFSLDGITKTINAINQIRRTKLNEGLVLLKFLYNMADLRRLADHPEQPLSRTGPHRVYQ